jgi:adenylate cyclase
MADERVQRRLAAILVADVVGYSRLVEQDEEGTRARLRSLHAEVIDPRIAADGGRIVKTSGDGILVEFGSIVDAVRNALAIQTAMSGRNESLPEGRRIMFRVGINMGDVIVEGDDIHGEGVNIAARLEGLCRPGEVYVSGVVHDQAAGKLAASFEDLGEQTVKNITRPVKVYRVHAGPNDTSATANWFDPLPLPEKASIAVLPFDNLGGDPEEDYFADGITEDIITGLSKIRWLFVIARNSSFTYKGQAVDVKEVGRDLGVRYVLEGSIRKVGNRVRATGQLIEAATGDHIWAERYDRDIEDIFALQDEITLSIVREVAPEIEIAEQERSLRRPPANLNAWDIYYRGMRHVYRVTPEDMIQADEYFRAAIDADPEFAPPRTGLAFVRYMQAWLNWVDSPREALEEALVLSEDAIRLDDKDAFAYFSLGRQLTMKGEFDAGMAHLKHALRLNPSLGIASYGMALGHLFSGGIEESLVYFDDAIRLSPRDNFLYAYQMWKGLALGYLGEISDAIELSRMACWRGNADINPHLFFASVLGQLGRTADAETQVAAVLTTNPEFRISRIANGMLSNMADPLKSWTVEGMQKAGLPQ